VIQKLSRLQAPAQNPIVVEPVTVNSRAFIDLVRGQWHGLVGLNGAVVTLDMHSDAAVLAWVASNSNAGEAYQRR